MQLKKLNPSLGAIKEALRDGAKVYAVGSHDDGCGYWYEIRKSSNKIMMMHEAGAIQLNTTHSSYFRINEFIALF